MRGSSLDARGIQVEPPAAGAPARRRCPCAPFDVVQTKLQSTRRPPPLAPAVASVAGPRTCACLLVVGMPFLLRSPQGKGT